MKIQPVQKRIEIIGGDITKLKVDAIVNAANSSLLGGEVLSNFKTKEISL